MKKSGEKLQKNEYLYQRLRCLHLSVSNCSLRKGGRDIFWPFVFIPQFRFLQHKHKSLPHGEPGGHVSLASFLCVHCLTASHHGMKIVKEEKTTEA